MPATAKSDGFAGADASALTTRLFPDVIKNANKLSGASQALKERWFGKRWVAVGSDLARITAFLNNGNSTVTFRKLSTAGNYGSVWPTVQSPYLKGAQKTTVGSGVMIRLEDLYFTTTDDEKANTIFHELAHKLILTNDGLGYDPAKLLAAATQKPEQAIKNAENWTQFYAEFLSGASSRSTSSGGGAVAGSSRPSPRALLGRCGGQ